MIWIIQLDPNCEHKCPDKSKAEGGLTSERHGSRSKEQSDAAAHCGMPAATRAGRGKEEIVPWSFQKERALPMTLL